MNETISGACHINIYSDKIIPIHDSNREQMVNLALRSGSDTLATCLQFPNRFP